MGLRVPIIRQLSVAIIFRNSYFCTWRKLPTSTEPPAPCVYDEGGIRLAAAKFSIFYNLISQGVCISLPHEFKWLNYIYYLVFLIQFGNRASRLLLKTAHCLNGSVSLYNRHRSFKRSSLKYWIV